MEATTPTTNPFGGRTLPPPSGDPDAMPCPTCGLELTPNFIPGAPAIHAQMRGGLGTFLPTTCRTEVVL